VIEGPVVGELVLHTYSHHLYCPAIEVSAKPASSSQAITKRAILNLTGTVPALERIEDTSSFNLKTVNV